MTTIALVAGEPHLVVGRGATLRTGVLRSSPRVGEVAQGSLVVVEAYAKDVDGTVRARVDGGWASAKLLRPLNLSEAIAAAGERLIVIYAINAHVGAAWHYGWMKHVLLARVPHLFFPVDAAFLENAGGLAGATRVLLVWNAFEHSRDAVERFIDDAAPCPISLYHTGDERTSDASIESVRPAALRDSFLELEAEDPAVAKAKDLARLYAKCAAVFRNYHDPLLSGVLTVPLGYKTEFGPISTVRARLQAERPHAWAFVGQGTKAGRDGMLAALRKVPGGVERTFDALSWNPPGTLGAAAYRDVLLSTKLAPAPSGCLHRRR